MSISLASLARDLGYTGKLPDGATNINKNADGTFSITVNGKTQTYDASGSVFSPSTKNSQNGNGNVNGSVNGNNNTDNTQSSGSVSGNGNRGGNGANPVGSIYGNGAFGAPTTDIGGNNPYNISAFGYGFNGNSGGSFTGGYDIDPKVLAQYANAFNAVANISTSMDFGLGDIFAQNSMSKLTNLLANAVTFNFDFSGLNAGAASQQADTRTETGTDNNTVETTDQSPASQTSEAQEEQQTAQAGSQDVRLSKEELARKNGYDKVGGNDIYYDKKSGKYYKYDDAKGKFTEMKGVKQVFNDSSYLGTDGKKYDINGNVISSTTVTQEKLKDFDSYFEKRVSLEKISDFSGKEGWTRDSIKDVFESSDKYDVKNQGGVFVITNKEKGTTVKIKFDASGKIASTEKVIKGSIPVATSYVKYNENGETAEVSSCIPGQTRMTVAYDGNGNVTSESRKKWMQNANGGGWVSTEETTYGKNELGNVSKYVPKFDISTPGYEKSKTDNRGIVKNNAGTWTQTDNPNEYNFVSANGLSSYIVDARTGNIIEKTTYEKKGGKAVKVETPDSSRVMYTDSQISQMFKEMMAAKTAK